MTAQAVLQALQSFTERLVQTIVLETTANLTEATPVDTGWARANWIPGLGAPPSKPVGANDNVGSAQSAQQSGITGIAIGYRLSQGNVNITNNVPYIRRLNEGSSEQAPAAFVQSSIARALNQAARLKSP